MRHITLTAAEDDNLGGVGLLIEGSRNLDILNPAQEGSLVAHDLFEHVNGIGNIGSGAGDELIALGAVWYVRGRHGDLHRPNNSVYSAEQSIGFDVTVCMRRWLNDERHFGMDIPRSKGHIDRDIFHYIFNSVSPEDEGLEVKRGDKFQFLNAARRFMDHGYALADRRYRGDGMKANSMFWNVADALDEQVFRGDLFEGQKFRLSYSRRDARVQEIYDDEYY